MWEKARTASEQHTSRIVTFHFVICGLVHLCVSESVRSKFLFFSVHSFLPRFNLILLCENIQLNCIAETISGENYQKNWIQMKSTTTTTTIHITTTTAIFQTTEHWKRAQDMHECELYQSMTNECWTVKEKAQRHKHTHKKERKEWNTESTAPTNVTSKICIPFVLLFSFIFCCSFFGFVSHPHIEPSKHCV